MTIDVEQEVGTGAARAAKRRRLPGAGLLKGLGVTLKHMLQRSITQEYPDEKPDLPPRTRGVIALKQENCTVCYKCSRECPDWCIYIDAHKETHEPASGGRARSVKVLDGFAIDYGLGMYCGICVEVCPFDALFWAPDFEYAEYDILEMTHEKQRPEEWTYKVLPPPPLEEGAEPPPMPEEVPVQTGGGEPVAARPPSAAETSAPGAQPPAEMAPRRGAGQGDRPAGRRRQGSRGRDPSGPGKGRGGPGGEQPVSAQEVAFVVLAVVGGVAALRLVTSRNVVHAALYLVVALAVVGGTYLLVAAEFLAWVQVLIYVGAIVVLLLFSLMLTKAPIGRETLDNQQRGWAVLVAAAVLAGLAFLVQDSFGGERIVLRPARTAQIGTAIFRDFVLPFEVVSVLLLAALIGAVVIARKEEAPEAGPERRVPLIGRRERVHR